VDRTGAAMGTFGSTDGVGCIVPAQPAHAGQLRVCNTILFLFGWLYPISARCYLVSYMSTYCMS
jgi:hypothetical protein